MDCQHIKPNLVCITDRRGVELWFSYREPVAFRVPGSRPVVSQNYWGTTTGRHLNAIDGGTADAKAARLNAEAFATALALWFGAAR